MSGQQLLQSTLHSDIAATAAERTAGGSEAVSGILMGSSNTTAFSLGSATVSTPMGHTQWGRDFSQQVSSFGQQLRNGLQTIELRLDPPDLGPIRISLSMSDNVAQASFISPHAAVRQPHRHPATLMPLTKQPNPRLPPNVLTMGKLIPLPNLFEL